MFGVRRSDLPRSGDFAFPKPFPFPRSFIIKCARSYCTTRGRLMFQIIGWNSLQLFAAQPLFTNVIVMSLVVVGLGSTPGVVSMPTRVFRS
jgi:hypothetical protein